MGRQENMSLEVIKQSFLEGTVIEDTGKPRWRQASPEEQGQLSRTSLHPHAKAAGRAHPPPAPSTSAASGEPRPGIQHQRPAPLGPQPCPRRQPQLGPVTFAAAIRPPEHGALVYDPEGLEQSQHVLL